MIKVTLNISNANPTTGYNSVTTLYYYVTIFLITCNLFRSKMEMLNGRNILLIKSLLTMHFFDNIIPSHVYREQ